MSLKLKFPHLRQTDVVRIRSVTFDETSSQKKVLNLSHYSNIMTFVSGSKLAKEVKSKVTDDKSIEKQTIKQDVMMNAVILSEPHKNHQHLPVTTL